MQWILAVGSWLAFFLQLIKCHPTVRTFTTKPFEWDNRQAELVYPQLHSADSPRIQQSSANSPSLLVLRTSSETFYIELIPNKDLVQSVQPGASKDNATKSCHFHGKVLSHGDGTAAISICDSQSKMTGTIMVQKNAFILHPLEYLEEKERMRYNSNSTNSTTETAPHVLSKVKDSAAEYCGLDHEAPSFHLVENDIANNHRFRRSVAKGSKVIETAVYVDYPLYKKFTEERRHSVAQLRDTVLAIINQVQIIYNYPSMKTKFKIVVVKIEFLTEGKAAPDPADGDIDEYLDSFCEWQSKRNSPQRSGQHWDHALMLSGYDLHKVTNGKKNRKVLGLAWVNGMCRPKHSCTLNEGSSFEAAFVIAHEMGHSLGMLHDGRGNDCDPSAYIMSEKTGPGRITWSACSNNYLEKFFLKGHGSCLEDGDSNAVDDSRNKLDEKLPGQRFDLEDQCKLSLGKEYRPHVMPKTPFNNVCRELWCVSGLWASVAHPALEGSSCGGGKQCIQGKCKSKGSISQEPEEENSSMEVRKLVTEFLDRLKMAFHFMLP